jgi:hypothetical protein
MMKSTKMSLRALTFSAALCASLGTSLSAFAETIEVQKLKHAGPYPVATPWMADSVNVKGEKFSMKGMLDSPLSFTLLNNGKEVAASQLLADSRQNALHLASFTISNTSRTQATIEVKGLKQYRLFVDGEQVKVNGDKAETVLMPSTHTIVIKYLTASSADASASEKNASEKSSSSEKKADQDFKISITAADGKQLSVGESSASTKRTFNIYDVICMPNYASVQMSPNGKFMIVSKTWVDRQGKNHSVNELRNCQTNKVVASFEESVRWMPRTNKLYFTEKASDSSIAGDTYAGLIAAIILVDIGLQCQQLSNQSGCLQEIPQASNRANTIFMTTYFIGGSLGTFCAGYVWTQADWLGVCIVGISFAFISLMISLSNKK